MPTITTAQLRAAAQQIKNETAASANTAARVGSTIEAAADLIEQVAAAPNDCYQRIDTLTAGLNTTNSNVATKYPKESVSFPDINAFYTFANSLGTDRVKCAQYNGVINLYVSGAANLFVNTIRNNDPTNFCVAQYIITSCRLNSPAWAGLYEPKLWSRYYQAGAWSAWTCMSPMPQTANANAPEDGYAQASFSAGKGNRGILVLGEPGSGAETKIFQNGGKLHFRRAGYTADGASTGYWTQEMPTATTVSNGVMSKDHVAVINTLITEISTLKTRIAALEAK